jgi:hypothetical protein
MSILTGSEQVLKMKKNDNMKNYIFFLFISAFMVIALIDATTQNLNST